MPEENHKPVVVSRYPKKCYASQHMHPKEWGLHEVALRLSLGGRNPYIFDGRKMSARFTGVGKTAIYLSVKKLVDAGWWVKTGGGDRNPYTGQKNPTIYKVLGHDLWTRHHGVKSCTKMSEEPAQTSSPQNGTGEASVPVPKNDATSPETAFDQSRKAISPVPNEGHISIKNSSIKNNPVKSSPVSTSSRREDPDKNPGAGSMTCREIGVDDESGSTNQAIVPDPKLKQAADAVAATGDRKNLERQLRDRQNKLHRLLADYGSDEPIVLSVRSDVENLQARFDEMTGKGTV